LEQADLQKLSSDPLHSSPTIAITQIRPLFASPGTNNFPLVSDFGRNLLKKHYDKAHGMGRLPLQDCFRGLGFRVESRLIAARETRSYIC
jgi:hypothetical protein